MCVGFRRKIRLNIRIVTHIISPLPMKASLKEANAICPLCWGLSYLPENTEEMCSFCNSELCASSFYQALEPSLKEHSMKQLEDMRENQKKQIKATHWWRDRRHRFYLKDFLSSIEAVIQLKRDRLKKEPQKS